MTQRFLPTRRNCRLLLRLRRAKVAEWKTWWVASANCPRQRILRIHCLDETGNILYRLRLFFDDHLLRGVLAFRKRAMCSSAMKMLKKSRRPIKYFVIPSPAEMIGTSKNLGLKAAKWSNSATSQPVNLQSFRRALDKSSTGHADALWPRVQCISPVRKGFHWS